MTGLLVNDRDIVFQGMYWLKHRILTWRRRNKRERTINFYKIGIVSINGRFVKLVPLVDYISQKEMI